MSAYCQNCDRSPCTCEEEGLEERNAQSSLAQSPGSAIALPNDTKIRFSNAFNAICRHITCCKWCHTYMIDGDGDMCWFGKELIAKELCYCDTSIEFPQNREIRVIRG